MNTAIKDFSIGDNFLHYGATFEVTGETKTFNEGGVIVFGRECKCINNPDKKSTISGLLDGYKWMQGTEEVKYCKVK